MELLFKAEDVAYPQGLSISVEGFKGDIGRSREKSDVSRDLSPRVFRLCTLSSPDKRKSRRNRVKSTRIGCVKLINFPRLCTAIFAGPDEHVVALK